jgi:hypothetical protein
MEAGWYNGSVPDVFTSEGRSLPGSKAGRRNFVELHCQQCGSSDLKKVSLSYQEGLYRVDRRTRLRGVLFGSDGPSVLIARGASKGIQHTELSKLLRPPTKWSYLKVVGWFGLVLFVSLIVYIHMVMASPSPVSSIATQIGICFLCFCAALMLVVVWRHNYFTYPRQKSKWGRSFMCQHCGAISEREIYG